MELLINSIVNGPQLSSSVGIIFASGLGWIVTWSVKSSGHKASGFNVVSVISYSIELLLRFSGNSNVGLLCVVPKKLIFMAGDTFQI